MKFLAINTAGAAVEIAIVTSDCILVKSDAEFKNASAVCLRLIDELLVKAGIGLKELNFIAIVTGPGSFTGIRIGLTIARALAQFAGIKLVPVTHAEVLSYHYNGDAHTASIVTVSDASNGWAYVAVFDENRDVLMPPAVLKNEQIEAFLKTIDGPYAVCTDAAMERFASPRGAGIPLVLAASFAYKRSGSIPYIQTVPLYVRKSQAEEAAKERIP